MSEIGTPPPLTVVRPGESLTGTVGAHGVVFKLWGQDTGGAVAIVEHPFPVATRMPVTARTVLDDALAAVPTVSIGSAPP
jgi:hypothetical protein